MYAGLVLLATEVCGFTLGSRWRVHAGRRGAVHPGAPPRAARGGPPVQPGPLRRRPDVAAFAARLQGRGGPGSVHADLAGAAQQALEPAHLRCGSAPGKRASGLAHRGVDQRHQARLLVVVGRGEQHAADQRAGLAEQAARLG